MVHSNFLFYCLPPAVNRIIELLHISNLLPLVAYHKISWIMHSAILYQKARFLL